MKTKMHNRLVSYWIYKHTTEQLQDIIWRLVINSAPSAHSDEYSIHSFTFSASDDTFLLSHSMNDKSLISDILIPHIEHVPKEIWVIDLNENDLPYLVMLTPEEYLI